MPAADLSMLSVSLWMFSLYRAAIAALALIALLNAAASIFCQSMFSCAVCQNMLARQADEQSRQPSVRAAHKQASCTIGGGTVLHGTCSTANGTCPNLLANENSLPAACGCTVPRFSLSWLTNTYAMSAAVAAKHGQAMCRETSKTAWATMADQQ